MKHGINERPLESGLNIEPVITHRYSYKDFEGL